MPWPIPPQGRRPIPSCRIRSGEKPLLPKVTHLIPLLHKFLDLVVVRCTTDLGDPLALDKPVNLFQPDSVEEIGRVRRHHYLTAPVRIAAELLREFAHQGWVQLVFRF